MVACGSQLPYVVVVSEGSKIVNEEHGGAYVLEAVGVGRGVAVLTVVDWVQEKDLNEYSGCEEAVEHVGLADGPSVVMKMY